MTPSHDMHIFVIFQVNMNVEEGTDNVLRDEPLNWKLLEIVSSCTWSLSKKNDWIHKFWIEW